MDNHAYLPGTRVGHFEAPMEYTVFGGAQGSRCPNVAPSQLDPLSPTYPPQLIIASVASLGPGGRGCSRSMEVSGSFESR
jgi:hypothetical protein